MAKSWVFIPIPSYKKNPGKDTAGIPKMRLVQERCLILFFNVGSSGKLVENRDRHTFLEKQAVAPLPAFTFTNISANPRSSSK
ncbi:hypothetical protein ACFPA1_24850 [Neobacillus sp. GCM10023253]|uniref:hypothetical protein n=1 Tax=Neobacillus sp. GCM10023253 TaxID=3252644 RepID=UPI0036141631